MRTFGAAVALALLSMGQAQMTTIAFAKNLHLGAGTTTAVLHPVRGHALGPALDALGSRRLYLVVRDLRTVEQPGVLYHLYLDLPAGTAVDKADPWHAGILNFFNAPPPGAPEPEGVFQSFDVTSLVRSLRARGQLAERVKLSIIPVGEADPKARPTIGVVELVAQ